MKKFNKSLMAGLVTAGLVASFGANATNGYFSHGYGTKHKGMAGAGVASPQDTMSAATNPAAIQSQAGRIDFGIEYFKPDRTVNVPAGGTAYDANGDSDFLIPEFGYSRKIDDGKSWGVVVYGNGGMNTNAPSAFYSGGNSSKTGMNMAQLFIAPTFAMKVNDKNDFGVSLNLIYQTFEAYGLHNFSAYVADGSTTYLTDAGEDTSTGFSLKFGWTSQLTDQLSLGVAYQTLSDMSEFDKYKTLFAENGDFDIPSNWTIGLTFKATPKMNVMFDVQQINYTDVASVSNPNSNTQGTLGTANGRGFGWDDMTVYKLGMDYQVNDKLIVRAGYSTTDQPIGADDTAFNAIAPAVVEDHLTFGATWTMASGAELSAFYMHAFENEVKGDGTTAGNADLKMSQDALGVSYGWKF